MQIRYKQINFKSLKEKYQIINMLLEYVPVGNIYEDKDKVTFCYNPDVVNVPFGHEIKPEIIDGDRVMLWNTILKTGI